MHPQSTDTVLVCRRFMPPQDDSSSPFMTPSEQKQNYILARLNVAGPDECWKWKLKPNDKHGYGRMTVNGKKVLSHRFSWEAFRGEIPTGLKVLHKCDNPACCNPAHLFLGTNGDNNADRDAKGRHKPLYGESNGLAKLNYDKARSIRAESKLGASQRELSIKYSVDQKAIWMVIHNVTWKEENFAKQNLERASA